MLMLLNQVVVHVSDMQRSIRFYRDQLGFPVKRESHEGTELHTGRTGLTLQLAAPDRRPMKSSTTDAPLGPGQASFGIEVLDLDKFYEEKKAKGVTFTLPPTKDNSGRKRAVITDPDGLPISVTEEFR